MPPRNGRRNLLISLAKADLDRALALVPDDPGALYERSEVLARLGDRSAALADLVRSLQR